MTGDQQIHQRVVALDDMQIRAGGDGRTVTAYAAVFDSPADIQDQDGRYQEQIARTAFDKTVKERAGRIGVFYHHARTLHGSPSDLGSVPIGTPVEPPRADGRGLLTVTRYNRSALADAVLESIKNGDITGQSFSGRFIKSDPKGPYVPARSGALTLVTRQEIALLEYGPTPIPAYADAEILGVRSAEGGQGNLDAERVADLDSDALAYATAQGWTMADGAHPIRDLDHHGRADLDAALAAVDSTTADDVRAHITQRAAAIGLSSLIPASWPSTSGTRPAASTPAAQRGTGAAQQPPARPGAAPEPRTHSDHTEQTRSTGMAREDERMTVEERTARLGEISVRLQEIDTEYSGATLPQDVQTEWDDLNGEHDRHNEAIASAQERAERLAQLAAVPGATERAGGGQQRQDGPSGRSGGHGRQAPGQIRRPENIYDLNEIRQQARSVDEMAGLYRDRAMRAVEIAVFPGAGSREEAQERAEYLLNDVDDEQGTLARRMLATGSPQYNRAFGRLLMSLSTNGLTSEESRALSLGVDASGGFAVPFQLDPTVILTSDGTINPLRQVAREVQITGKKWEGVTTAGVTVTRGAEGDEAPDSSPTLAQPSVDTQRVQGFVPFTVELEASWNAMRSEITMLLQDAKDNEEATSFFLGDGTGTNPGGLIGTMPSGSRVGQTGSAGALTVPDDLFAVENALGPRFRRNATWMANKAIYSKIRGAAESKGGLAGDLWARLSGGQPPELIGYPAYEASAMDGVINPSGAGANYVAVLGDFRRGFIIVDRIGMSIELVPHLFGANGRPTGQRGIYAYWSNNCKVLVPNAFRVLNVVSPT